MTFSFHPEAEAEFNEAIEYYENKELLPALTRTQKTLLAGLF